MLNVSGKPSLLLVEVISSLRDKVYLPSTTVRRSLPSLFISLFFLFMTSCGGEDCVINNTVTATMNFYNSTGKAVSIRDELTVSVVRPGRDSVILNRKADASSLTFPLGYVNECDTFVFKFLLSNIVDSVFIHHDNQPYFISLDCGMAMFHTITSADCTHNLMQSVAITRPEINYDVLENLQIRFSD